MIPAMKVLGRHLNKNKRVPLFFLYMDPSLDDTLKVRNQDLERISAMISINCWSVIGLCLFASMVLGVTVLLPGAVPVEKQIFVGLACLAILCPIIGLGCAKRNPAALTLFTWIAATGAGILIGIGAMILAPHVVIPITQQ